MLFGFSGFGSFSQQGSQPQQSSLPASLQVGPSSLLTLELWDGGGSEELDERLDDEELCELLTLEMLWELDEVGSSELELLVSVSELLEEDEELLEDSMN